MVRAARQCLVRVRYRDTLARHTGLCRGAAWFSVRQAGQQDLIQALIDVIIIIIIGVRVSVGNPAEVYDLLTRSSI